MCLEENCGEVSEGRRSFLGGAFRVLAASALVSKVFGRQQASQPQVAKPLEPLSLDDPSVTHGPLAFKSEGAVMNGYLARPKAAGRYPAVVIFSPNPGLTDDLRNTAAQLAQAGFLGLAFDAYSREQPGLTNDRVRERFEHFASRAFDERWRRDGAAGLEHLRRQPYFKRGRVGVMGFCGGARQALVFSTESREVGAVVNFYAPPVLNPAAYQSRRGPFKLDVMDVLDKIRAPVQCHYGAADPIIPLADVERLERDLKAQGTPTEVYVYEGAAHAFYDFTRPRFHPEAARLARARMIQFLRRHLLV